jgi:hypothetical protein
VGILSLADLVGILGVAGEASCLWLTYLGSNIYCSLARKDC